MTNETDQPTDVVNGETAEPTVPETPPTQPDAAQPPVDAGTPALEEAVDDATNSEGFVAPEGVEASAASPEPAPTPEAAEVEDAAPEPAAVSEAAEVEGGPDEAASEEIQAEPAAAKPQKVGPPSRFTRGDLIPGKLLTKSPLAITFDLGEGAVGEVMSRELERMAPQQLAELTEGGEYTVFVVNPSNHEGKTLVSLNRAGEEIDWRTAEQYRADQRVFEGVVAGFNKGGLIVRFGRLRGFVPLSQMSDERRRALLASSPDQ